MSLFMTSQTAITQTKLSCRGHILEDARIYSQWTQIKITRSKYSKCYMVGLRVPWLARIMVIIWGSRKSLLHEAFSLHAISRP